ncbi:MAG TPA: hypothetical protein VGB89_02455, partial [Bacteroidota bacterium]
HSNKGCAAEQSQGKIAPKERGEVFMKDFCKARWKKASCMNKDGDGVVSQVRWWLDVTAPSSICLYRWW